MLLRELAKTPMEFEFSLSYELVQCLLIDEFLEIPEAMWVCALNFGLLLLAKCLMKCPNDFSILKLLCYFHV